MHNKIQITRYNKTRNWAIWVDEELLAVTVYKKGAEAVLNYINNISKQTNKSTTMAKTKSTETDPCIIKATTAEGKTVRIKFDPLGVSVCYTQQGKWKADEIYNEPLPELIAEGIFTIEDDKSQKKYERYFGKKNKRRSKRKPRKQQNTIVPAQEEAPADFEENIDKAADEEIEAAIWQEIEEERENERINEEQFLQIAEKTETNAPVTDVEPTAEALAPESDIEAAEPEAAEEIEIKLSTYNLKRAGQAPAKIPGDAKVIELHPGDQLIRIYKGKTIEVDVTESGYKWDEEIYPTLTHISWKAAGYQIGGNAFFGLPSKPRTKA